MNKNAIPKNAKVTLWAVEAQRVHELANAQAVHLNTLAIQARADVDNFEKEFEDSLNNVNK